MNNFGSLISNNVLGLSLLQKKALKPQNALSNGLLCDSKKTILQAYMTTISNVIVMTGSICQLLSEFRTVDDVNNRISHAKKVFKRSFIKHIASELLKVEHCSSCPKSAMLFGILQGQLEDVLFEEVRTKLIQYIGCMDDGVYFVCEEILDMIYDFAEAAIFHLSGLRINCTNISELIFTDDRFQISTSDLSSLSHRCQSAKEETFIDKQPKSCLFTHRHRKECLHLFLCDEFFKVRNWMDVYINLYKTYHNEPKKITLILDYRLIEEDTDWSIEDYERYVHALDVFGRVCIINFDHINFGSYEDLLATDSLDMVEECVYE